MSRKAILNMTSVKKRDTMRIATINSGSATAAPMRGVSLGIANEQFYAGIWCPTWRLFDSTDSTPASRQSRTVYWKGFAERYRIETQTNYPIEMRRIVYSTPDRIQLIAGAPAQASPPFFVEQTSNRYWRTTGDGQMNIDYLDDIFAGVRGVDWLNPMNAKTDTRRVKIISDKKYKIASGNDRVMMKELKFYDALEKNMTYDDDENGGLITTTGFSEVSRAGALQNVYVVNLFYATANIASSFSLDIDSTVYWHER